MNKSFINAAFIDQIRALWAAEAMLNEEMPSMIEKANNLGLRKNLALHFAETRQQKVALELICKQLDINLDGATNASMQTLIADGNDALSNAGASAKDATLIQNAIKIEHSEIEAYEAILQNIESTPLKGVYNRLARTLEEEKQAHIKLHFYQKNFIDKSAALGIVEHQHTS